MTAIKAQLTTLEVQLASLAYQAICGTSISGLGSGTAAEIDTTTLCSTAKEYVMGLKDEGSMTFSVNYDPADVGIKRLQALRDSQELGVFKMTLVDPGSEEWAFSGYVTSAPLGDVTPDTVYTMTFTIRISGAITIT